LKAEEKYHSSKRKYQQNRKINCYWLKIFFFSINLNFKNRSIWRNPEIIRGHCSSTCRNLWHYHIWAILVAALRSQSCGHFWSALFLDMSYFREWNSSFGRCRFRQLSIIWETICMFFFLHSRLNLEVRDCCHFALYSIWSVLLAHVLECHSVARSFS